MMFYGLPKIHKPTMPMRPIVSSIDSITYTCAKHIADIITPVVGNTSRHVKNSDQFSKLVRNFRVEHDQELRSYNVTALFTSVPVNKAVDCIRRKLEADVTLKQRTDMSPADICRVLELCLSCTYFVFDGQFYRQIHGAAMGSPVSMIVCDAQMEDVEEQAIATAEHPPYWWYRYVDDTHTKLDKTHASSFTDHLNTLDEDIKFTTEGEEEGALAFLDTNTVKKDDGLVKVMIYRKPTHTDQYLNFHSNHPLDHKLSVVQTVHHRARTVISEEEDVKKELDHVNVALNKGQQNTDGPATPPRRSPNTSTGWETQAPNVSGRHHHLRQRAALV
jgi:hypothetical protein